MSEITLTFKLPSDEDAMGAIAQMVQKSGMPAENQISLRAWFTQLLQDAGRLDENGAAPEAHEGEVLPAEH